MLRSVFLLGLVFSLGHPALDGVRPAALDTPMRAFHEEVFKAAASGGMMVHRFQNSPLLTRAARVLRRESGLSREES